MSESPIPSDENLIRDSYEALEAIYAAGTELAAAPGEGELAWLKGALDEHRPLLDLLERRVAP